MSINIQQRVERLSKLVTAANRGEKIVRIVNKEPVEVDIRLKEQASALLFEDNNIDDWQIVSPPAPSLPFGVFWVTRKYGGDSSVYRLVILIDIATRKVWLTSRAGTSSNGYVAHPVTFSSLFKEYTWSRDRKTWYSFVDHATPLNNDDTLCDEDEDEDEEE